MNSVIRKSLTMDHAEAGTAAGHYLRNAWYPTAWSRDVGEKPTGMILLEEEIVIYRTESGAAAAMGNRCPHRFAELHLGKVVGENIQCPYHELQFNPAGGCAHNPHGPTRPAAAHVKSYPTVERHGLIWLWMGDRDRANPDLIPDYSILEDANHSAVTGYLDIDGEYQLYNDNLLDLSHTEFVHPDLLQPGSLDRSAFEVRTEGDTVHFVRESPKEPATGTFQRMLCEGMGGKSGDTVTTRHHIRWDAPAFLYTEITQFWQDKHSVFTQIHFPLPTTHARSRLMFASIRDVKINDKELDDYILKGMTYILGNEDIPMIESQGTFIKDREFFDLKPALLKTDEAAVRARRILARRIREEEGGASSNAA